MKTQMDRAKNNRTGKWFLVVLSLFMFSFLKAGVTIQATTSTPNVTRGSIVNYTITVTGTGGGWFGSLVTTVNNILPTGFTYVPGSTTGSISSDPNINGSQLTWNPYWWLGKNQTATISFSAQAPLQQGSFGNSASCSGWNASASVGPTAFVQLTAPDLILNKSVDKASVDPGDILTYTITYANTGDGSATSVFILEDIPANTEYVVNSAVGSNMTITYSDNGGSSYGSTQSAGVTDIMFMHSGNLTVGGSGSVSFQVKII